MKTTEQIIRTPLAFWTGSGLSDKREDALIYTSHDFCVADANEVQDTHPGVRIMIEDANQVRWTP